MSTPEWPHELNAETWDSCDSLWLFADFLVDEDECPDPPPERKFRLLVVAALRAVWHHVTEPESRAAVEEAERYADEPDPVRLKAAEEAAQQTYYRVGEPWSALDPDKRLAKQIARAAWYAATEPPFNDASSGPPFWADTIIDLESGDIPDRTPEEAATLHLALFRDVLPNPFLPVVVDPEWRTSTVLALCEQMYRSGDFSPMPILADALQDAGCGDPHILSHCRSDGPHVRGCWMVDLVLGKG